MIRGGIQQRRRSVTAFRRRNLATSSFDVDAQAFFTAAAITDGTQKTAINTLVLTLKSASIWTKLYALYPFVGGAASPHSYNLVNPALYQISWTGGVTHASTGVTFNGSTGYGDTQFVPLANGFTTTSGSFGFYRRTNALASGYDMGCSDDLDVNALVCIARYSSGNQFAVYGGSYQSVANADARGFYSTNRNGGTNTEGYKNGTKTIDAVAAVTIPTGGKSMLLGAENRGTTGIVEYCAEEMAAAYISQGLAAQNNTDLYTAIQAYETALSRNV